MRPAKAISKDDVPVTSASGAGAEETRICNAIDPNFSDADVELRLKKQKDGTSLHRVGQTPQPNQKEPPYNERVQECGPLDLTYKGRK